MRKWTLAALLVVAGRSSSLQLGEPYADPGPNFVTRGIGALMESGGPTEDRTTLPGLNEDGTIFRRKCEKEPT